MKKNNGAKLAKVFTKIAVFKSNGYGKMQNLHQKKDWMENLINLGILSKNILKN